MTKLKNQHHRSIAGKAHWAWLVPIFALSPLSLAAKGCTNSGVVGDECPTTADCPIGTGGSSSQAGTGNTPSKTCGGLLGAQCAKTEFCAYAANAMCGAADQTGTCQTRPEVCDDIYAPVCGCDDKTYSSDCVANSAGVSVASKGECGSNNPNPGDGVCGGLLGTPCKDGEYCNFDPATQCGSGDQTGKCQAMPDACTKEYVPVCGCDGVTYGNACEAARAGASVASKGECPTNPAKTCGGKIGATCDADQYCAYPPEADCGRFDSTGTCVDIPKDSVCLAVEDPVCGCDGKTYSNSCYAELAGVSIDHDGECIQDPTGKACGGITGEVNCGADEYCDYPLETMCGSGDQQGTCKPIPEVCTDDVNPVCGCDSKPYSNSCEANARGVSVMNQGACPK